MKKIMLFLVMLTMFTITLNVSAVNTGAEKGKENYEKLLAEYNKGIQKVTVNGTQTITLYGYSNCTSSGCVYKYSNVSNDYKEILKSAITCAGGEKYINVQTTSNSDVWYKNSNEYIGEAAWSEDFNITCTNSATRDVVELNNSTIQPTTQPTTQPTNNSTNDGEYGSADTTQQDSYGVETYYIILGVVALITYFLTILIKKQNLFKKV